MELSRSSHPRLDNASLLRSPRIPANLYQAAWRIVTPEACYLKGRPLDSRHHPQLSTSTGFNASRATCSALGGAQSAPPPAAFCCSLRDWTALQSTLPDAAGRLPLGDPSCVTFAGAAPASPTVRSHLELHHPLIAQDGGLPQLTLFRVSSLRSILSLCALVLSFATFAWCRFLRIISLRACWCDLRLP